MNTEKNQRYRETEDRIMDAFLSLIGDREPEKVSVSRICERCGINRSSFYLHFTDVYDLMTRIDRRCSDEMGEIFLSGSGEWNIGRRFAAFFRYVGEHREFYRVYLDRCRDSRLLAITLSERAELNVSRLKEELGFLSEEELNYHHTFFRAGLAAMLREWLSRGCPETPEEMAAILSREYTHGREG